MDNETLGGPYHAVAATFEDPSRADSFPTKVTEFLANSVGVSKNETIYQPVEKLGDVPFHFGAGALIYAAFDFGASREG